MANENRLLKRARLATPAPVRLQRAFPAGLPQRLAYFVLFGRQVVPEEEACNPQIAAALQEAAADGG